LEFVYQIGGQVPAPQQIPIITSPNNFAISVSTSGQSWLNATLSQPMSPATLTITVNPIGLAPGTYLGVVSINAPNVSAFNVQVNLSVTPGPLSRGVLSHVAAGGGWTTVITLINTSTAAVPVTVALHNDDGSALTLPLTTTQQGISQTSSTSSVSTTINPNVTLLISMGGQAGSTVVGWADVDSTGPVNGYAIFRTASSNSPVSEGTVPLQTQFPSTITLPYDNTNGFVMGVALANLSTSSANATATVWDANGNQLGTQTIAISGNGHTSFVLPTQLPMTAGQLGIVQFQSSGGIAGLGLRFSPFGTFTSVPTM
jgi:hypothetical protein